MNEELTISNNIDIIRSNIEKACLDAGRKNDVEILLATKMQSPERINAAIACGIRHIGENKVQELLEKYDSINKENVTIHFIGPLQTNKVKYIIDKVDMIQSVDRMSLALEINKRALQHGIVMSVLAEVNICGEATKSGVAPEKLEEFLESLSKLSNIRVEGIMAVPPIMTDIDTQKQIFKKIMQLFIDISQKKLDNSNMRILSFGMSGDYVQAVSEGSNMVRIGSAVFGKRDYQK